jgi:hypothetical protein
MDDFGRFVADLNEQGLDPVVGVESTSAGDVFIVRFGDDEDPLTGT